MEAALKFCRDQQYLKITLDTGGRPPLMHIVVLGPDGAHAGASTGTDKTYLHWEHGMSDFATLPRRTVTA